MIEEELDDLSSYLPITLRDYFAAHALVGAVSRAHDDLTTEDYSKVAYLLADAMLKEREK